MYIKWVGEIAFGGEGWQFYGIRPWSPRCISSSFIYFKLSALGMFQQVSICILKMSPAVNQWGERVIHWIWEERWEDSYGEISVMKQLRRRSGLSVFAFDRPSRWPDFPGLRASLGLGRVHWALHTALECQDPIPGNPDTEHGLEYLSSVYPTPDFCVGDFYFSPSDYLMNRMSPWQAGFFCLSDSGLHLYMAMELAVGKFVVVVNSNK